MKVISAIATLAAIGTSSALNMKLTAEQPFEANAFMIVLAEQLNRPDAISHQALLELSDDEFQTKVLGEDHGLTDEHIATFKDYHRYNLKMDDHQRMEMHLSNYKRMADEEQALLQDEEVEESLLQDEEGEEVTGWKRRRRRLNANRRRRRQEDKKNGPNYSPDWTQTELWEFMDIMSKVKTGLRATTPTNAVAGQNCHATNQLCVLHSQNSYTDCICKYKWEDGADASGAANGDAVCLAIKGNKCVLGFRGSDHISDWVGYLGLFAWASYNTDTFGNSQEWSIEVGKAFANEWYGIDHHVTNLLNDSAGGCHSMVFAGSSLGGVLAEVAYEFHKGDYTSSIVTLDTPKVSSKDSECGDWDSCTGCRGGNKYYRAWYQNSLISAVPNKSMYLLLGSIAAVVLFFVGWVIPGIGGAVTTAIAAIIVAYAVIAFVIADKYHHVTSVDGSFKLNAYGSHTGRNCRSNPGWAGYGNIGPTAKYHAISYWMGNYGDNTWYTNNQPAYEDPTNQSVTLNVDKTPGSFASSGFSSAGSGSSATGEKKMGSF